MSYSNEKFAANLVEQRKYQVRITQEELASKLKTSPYVPVVSIRPRCLLM